MVGAARFLCSAAAFASLFAQPNSTPPVLRITVNLVQVDAVVTDSNGRQVTNLGAQDFELLEDGRPQKITACTYVKIANLPSHRAASPTPPRESAPREPLALHLQREQVRRTVVLLVDDLGLSFESTHRVRRALRKFVDDQMQSGDLVAIIRTRGGTGALQQFTDDKRILYEAIDRVRWYIAGGHVSTFAPIGYDHSPSASRQGAASGGTQQIISTGPKQGGVGDQGTLFSVGTLGGIDLVIRALRDLPGRKAVVLFSDGLPALMSGTAAGGIFEGLRQLADLANRSAVVLYTVDARGLQNFGLTAADNTNLDRKLGARDPTPSAMTPQELAAVAPGREREFLDSEDGMDYLAHETGGFFMHNNNDLDSGIVRALQDMSGYYLIGYKPEQSSFELEGGRRRFHTIQVKVKQAGLHVRSRTGYIGIPDEETRSTNRTPAEQLIAALNSPFDSGGLRLRLTCLFSEEPKAGAAVRMLLHVDAHDLTYSEEPDRSRRVAVDVIAYAMGEQGVVAGSNDHTYNIRLSPSEYHEASSGGLVYKMNVNLAKPGAYQIRVAVRDATSGRIGSASQFVEVPDWRQHHLALSGIIMNGPQVEDINAGTASKDYSIAKSGTAAMRVFHPGESISFAYAIFDARTEPNTKHAKLETQFSLYRDGQRVYSSAITPVNAQQSDPSRLIGTGTLLLAPSLPPGEYMFQAIARDQLAPQKYQTASQWIDLELVR